MKISYNWLESYVPLEQAPEDLADALTMAGLEVEEIAQTGDLLDNVLVGEVLEVAPHPDADKLTICRVSVGSGDPLQVICGAPNVAVGQRVPVATAGAVVQVPDRNDPDRRIPLTIKRTRLRGQVSEGMICAEDELGLSQDHSGIMVLDENSAVGEPFPRYLRNRGISPVDYVLDIAITPNRPDAVSHIGVARDLAALSGSTSQHPKVSIPEPGGEAARYIGVEIDNPEGCNRYSAIVVRDVRIGESPVWLKQRLTAVGLRPRNNVVDITNFVMYECGQPLHAFDYARIRDQRIVVRDAVAGERFTTLDGKTRSLTAGTLLICDAERPIAIAGIMGGEESEVSDETRDILIESAWFNPSLIRKGSKELGLQTDSSYRFERGVDPEGTIWAAARAADMMVRYAGGTLVSGVVDERPVLYRERRLQLRTDQVRRVLGIEISASKIVGYLEAIGFSIVQSDDDILECTVPSFRPDVEREVDIIEEIARLHGYDSIPSPTHTMQPYITPHQSPHTVLRNQVRDLLVGAGYREIYTNSMLPVETAQRFGTAELIPSYEGNGVVETLNPISREMAALRPSLLPGVLHAVARNQNRSQRTIRFAEFGRIFQKSTRDSNLIDGYEEHESLIMCLSGLASEETWTSPERPFDFFDIKGIVSTVLAEMEIQDVSFRNGDASSIFACKLDVFSGNESLGSLGTLAEEVETAVDLRMPLFFAELNWDILVDLGRSALRPRYSPVSKYPVVDRDIAVVVDRAHAVGEMLTVVEETAGPLLRERVRVFDLYEGENIGPDRKSVAFALRLGADRTLVDDEVDQLLRRILKRLEQEHGAVLRQ